MLSKAVPSKGVPLGQEIYSLSLFSKAVSPGRNHLTFSPSCESYQLKSYRRLDWKRSKGLPWARGCFPRKRPRGGSARGGSHWDLQEERHQRKRINSGEHPSGQRRRDATEGDRLAHFCLLLPYRGPAVGEQEPPLSAASSSAVPHSRHGVSTPAPVIRAQY